VPRFEATLFRVSPEGLARAEPDPDLEDAARISGSRRQWGVVCRATDRSRPWVVDTVALCLLPGAGQIDTFPKQALARRFEALCDGNELSGLSIGPVVPVGAPSDY
jgi:hypothetical protein